MDSPQAVPIVLIVFNRPKETREVFARIRDWAPEGLYIIADGPRKGSIQDEVRCQAARAVIDEGVDWPCRVKKLYADENMGCGRRILSGLNTVFEHEDWAIILEDDCVPSPSFFPFAAELLKRYEQTPEIMQISGNRWNLGTLAAEDKEDYFFSRIPPCWGWATWRRAWSQMSWDAPDWPRERNDPSFFSKFHNEHEKRRIKHHWDAHFLEGQNSWAYRWHYTIYKHNALSIIPLKNLIVNIGCNLAGTHTQGGLVPVFSYEHETQTFPLKHPEEIVVSELYDAHYEKLSVDFYTPKINISERIKGPLRKLKRLGLSLSTRLNPKIKAACSARNQRLAEAFPAIKKTSTHPGKYSIHKTLELIQAMRPKHILEIGSGSAPLHLLDETGNMRPCPHVTVITHKASASALIQSAIDYFSQQKKATCVQAPLEETDFSLDGSFWYSKSVVTKSLKAKPPVDFLWIHGPVNAHNGSSLPLYTAIPELKAQLTARCTIIICPTSASEAVFLSETLRKSTGLQFKNAYARYGCLMHTP